MRHIHTPLLLPVTILFIAAGGRDFRELEREPAPAWLPVPVAGVKPSTLRDSWGDPRSGGRSHEGIDIMAPRGTAVLSATRGVVQSMRWSDNGGNGLWLLGPAGHRHYYAHLDSYADVAEGEWVEAGDTLGFVGTTGNAQGGAPHLHYGIYTDTGATNPFPLLTADRRGRAARPSNAGEHATTGEPSTNQGGGPSVATRRRTTPPATEDSASSSVGDGSGGVAARRRR